MCRTEGSRTPKRSRPCFFLTVGTPWRGHTRPRGRAQLWRGRARFLSAIPPKCSWKWFSLLLEGTMKLNGGRERLYSLVLNLFHVKTLFLMFFMTLFKFWMLLTFWFPFVLKLVELMFFLENFCRDSFWGILAKGTRAAYWLSMNFYNLLQNEKMTLSLKTGFLNPR